MEPWPAYTTYSTVRAPLARARAMSRRTPSNAASSCESRGGKTIADLCGRPDLRPIYIDPRPGDVLTLQADTRRAQEELGFRPELDFENGLRRYISWFRARHNDVSALLEGDVRNW